MTVNVVFQHCLMSGATPKAQAKEPIQLDILLVCRKVAAAPPALSTEAAILAANEKLERLRNAGFVLSANDRRIVRYGQLLATLRSPAEVDGISEQPSEELASQP